MAIRMTRPTPMDPVQPPSTSTRASRTRCITRRIPEMLPAQRSGAGSFLGIRQVECLAVLAAVDFRVLAELLLHFIAEKEPALEVTGAELALVILFITGAHARDAALDLGAVAERRNQLGDGNRLVTGCVFRIRHI